MEKPGRVNREQSDVTKQTELSDSEDITWPRRNIAIEPTESKPAHLKGKRTRDTDSCVVSSEMKAARKVQSHSERKSSPSAESSNGEKIRMKVVAGGKAYCVERAKYKSEGPPQAAHCTKSAEQSSQSALQGGEVDPRKYEL